MAFINLGQVVYPVGSVYISVSSVSPSDLFGGVWIRIEQACIRANSSSGGNYGYIGEDTHTLTIEEMPAHQHGLAWEEAAFNDRKMTTNLWLPLPHVWHTEKETKVADGTCMEYSGENKPHNNIPRSFQCFVWRRTA